MKKRAKCIATGRRDRCIEEGVVSKPESLYDLSAQYRRLLDTAASPEAHEPGVECEDGEVTDEFCAALERIEGALADKVDGYGYVRAGLLHRAEELCNEEDRLARRRARLERRVEQLEKRLCDGLRVAALERIEGARWTATLPKPQRKVDVYDLAALPRDLFRPVPEPPEPQPDKIQIAKALKAGVPVPGARLVDGVSSLRWS